MVGIIGGIIDGIVKRVNIIIKGVGIIIKGVIVIERVATFPETRLRHFRCFGVWKVCGFNAEDSKDGLLSEVRSTDRVLEAEEKRGRSYLAALFANTRANQLVKDRICSPQCFVMLPPPYFYK